jgi:N-acetylneuraminic acid mutarotase
LEARRQSVEPPSRLPLPNGWSQISDASGSPPFERANHSAVVIDDKLIIYGGEDSTGNLLNDMVILELTRQSWTNAYVNRHIARKAKKAHTPDVLKSMQHSPSQEPSQPPGARSRHTAIRFMSSMIVMGGCPADVHGDIFFLDTTTMTWSKFAKSSSPPEVKVARSQHCAALWKTNMVVFGGINGDVPLNSLILFDIQKGKWSVLKTSLPAVYGHSCFVRGDLLFIIGGAREGGASSNFIGCSLVDGSLIQAGNYFPSLDLNIELLSAVFDPLLDRLYIFGGFAVTTDDEEVGCTDQLHIVDLRTQTIATLFAPLVKDGPSPRCGHSMEFWDNTLIVFGGCNRLPLLTGEWVFCDFSNAVWRFLCPPAGVDVRQLGASL